MPPVQVIFYQEDDGTVPTAEWIDGLEKKPREKCFEWIGRLRNFGYEPHGHMRILSETVFTSFG